MGEQPGGAVGGETGGGEPGGLGLDGDHRDVVRDDVVQLPRDARPFTPGGVFEEGVREGLFGRAVGLCRAADVVGDAGGRGGGGEGGHQDGDDPGQLLVTAEGDHDVGENEDSAEAGGSGASQHVHADQLGHDPGDGEPAEGHEGEHAGEAEREGGAAAQLTGRRGLCRGRGRAEGWRRGRAAARRRTRWPNRCRAAGLRPVRGRQGRRERRAPRVARRRRAPRGRHRPADAHAGPGPGHRLSPDRVPSPRPRFPALPNPPRATPPPRPSGHCADRRSARRPLREGPRRVTTDTGRPA